MELLLWIIYDFSVLCLLCLCARLFICVLWSPAGKGLSFVVSNCEFVTFLLVSWVRYLIVSIPDLCTLTYFDFHCHLQITAFALSSDTVLCRQCGPRSNCSLTVKIQFGVKACNMYDVYLFNMLFTKFLLTQILEILIVNKLL